MALGTAFSVIWLDFHIGRDGVCNDLKKKFQVELAPAAAAFPATVDPIDALICCIREFAAPLAFASNIEDGLNLIEAHLFDEKRVIIITSASLGKEFIPRIRQRQFQIHSYYIFCGVIANHVDWVCEHMDDGLEIQMFDFELDLLIRLSRDLSNELIEQGKQILDANPKSSLNYFECARSLAEHAVRLDTPKDKNDLHRPSTKHRQILDGENGLIEKARKAIEDQNK